MALDIKVSSAGHDENGHYVGGKAGDQTGGEVCIRNFYVPSKGLYVLRPKSIDHATKIAERAIALANNDNIGYDQGNRGAIWTDGINSKKPTECDCSSSCRQIIKEATGTDPGNFTTYNLATKLAATGLFEKKFAFVSLAQTPVYNGDIVVTKTKGHTMTVVSGNPRVSTPVAKNYYPKYTGTSVSIVTALGAVGEKNTSKVNRVRIAAANGITNYTASAEQNTAMLKLLKAGKLIKA